MPDRSLRPWFVLRAVPDVGDTTVARLIQAFGSADAVLAASEEDLRHRGSVSRDVARAIRQGPDAEACVCIDEELKALGRLKVTVVTLSDRRYPPRLKAIHDPPSLLYVTGELTEADAHAVAIVGARRITPAGRLVTERLSRDLAAAGFTIVSGMARGADAAAHRGALAAGGRTIAVMGCGIDRTYPPEHGDLRQAIERHGAVISEFPLGAFPHAHHFPRRNRLISGLSLGVVVTEAKLESGSLITARAAAEQGREVFAVPGPIHSDTSRGPNGLIKQGAKLVEGAEDVIEEVEPQLDAGFRDRLKNRKACPIESQPELEQKQSMILGLLSADPIHIDELISKTRLPAADISGALLEMELKGLIRQLPGQTCVRIL